MEKYQPSWIDKEFENIHFKDARLDKRFKCIFINFMKHAQSSISSCFNTWSAVKACYRFFSNKKVESFPILKEHIKAAITRINEDTNKCLILHDTTYVDYKKHIKSTTLDKVFRAQKGKDGSLGLILHNSLAVSASGVPYGLLNQKFVKRDTINHPDRNKTTKAFVHTKPVEEKESYRWIEAINNIDALNSINKEVVHIADREADFYELYKACDRCGIKFLIRAKENRSINKIKRREKPRVRLFDYFQSLPEMISTDVRIQVNKDTKYRRAALSISFGEFMFPPPPDRTCNKDGKDLRSIRLWGVLVKEKEPPSVDEAIDWLLISNVQVSTKEEAIEKISWYTRRWDIETFHKVLKSGCSIELAQLRNRDRLMKYITIKSVVAWRILWLSRNFIREKKASCATVLNKLEQEVLYKRFNKGAALSGELSAKKAINWIGKLGGYIGRKSDPPPGIISLWRGWTRLMDMVEDYQVLVKNKQ